MTVKPWSHSCAVPRRAVFRPGMMWACNAAGGRFNSEILPESVDFNVAPSGRFIVIGLCLVFVMFLFIKYLWVSGR